MKFKARFHTEIQNGDLRVGIETFKTIITDSRRRAWDLAMKSAKRRSNRVEKTRVLEIINPKGYKPERGFGLTIGDILRFKKEREARRRF